MPTSLALLGSDEAHMVVRMPDAPDLVVISSDDELMEDFEEDLKEEHQIDHKVKEIELSVSDCSFDSSKDPEDGFDLDYDPSRDR